MREEILEIWRKTNNKNESDREREREREREEVENRNMSDSRRPGSLKILDSESEKERESLRALWRPLSRALFSYHLCEQSEVSRVDSVEKKSAKERRQTIKLPCGPLLLRPEVPSCLLSNF